MSVNERFLSEPFLGRSFQEINNIGGNQSSELSPSNFRIRHIAANQDRMILTMNTWVLEMKRIFSALQKESAFNPLRKRRHLFYLKPSSYHTVNTLRIDYKNQSVNSI